MMVIPFIQVQLTQIIPFTMYMMQKQQTQLIVWRLIVAGMVNGYHDRYQTNNYIFLSF